MKLLSAKASVSVNMTVRGAGLGGRHGAGPADSGSPELGRDAVHRGGPDHPGGREAPEEGPPFEDL